MERTLGRNQTGRKKIWSGHKRRLIDVNYRIEKPVFGTYEDLEEILGIAFGMYEDFKKALIQGEKERRA